MLQKLLVPCVEVRSLRNYLQYHRKAVRQALVTIDFDIHTRGLQSFCIGKGFVPQDVGSCALYHYIIGSLAD